MRFGFTDFQEDFQREVRNVLTKACTPAAVRTAWGEGADRPDRAAWSSLAEMGVLEVVVPEADGGLGLDEVSLVLILQEAGYAGLPDPLVETAAVAMPLAAASLEDRASTITTDLGGPLVPWALDADLLLLRSGDNELRLLKPHEVAVEAVETVDGSRRAGRITSKGGGAVVTENAAAVD